MFCWIISKKLSFPYLIHSTMCIYSVWDAECFASNVWLLFPQECWYLTHPHYQLDGFDWQRHPQRTTTCFVHLLRPKSEYYSFIKWTKWSSPCVYFGYQLLEYSTLTIELLNCRWMPSLIPGWITKVSSCENPGTEKLLVPFNKRIARPVAVRMRHLFLLLLMKLIQKGKNVSRQFFIWLYS